MNEMNANEQFVQLLMAHESRLYAFILSLLPNRTHADDILQETALVLFRRFAEFRPGTNFFSWACRIALHKVLDFRKRQSRSHTVLFGPELMETIAEEHLSQAEELETRAEALEQCMQNLRPGDRDLVEMSYRSNVFLNEVARTLNCPVDTIYKKLRRIRAILYECVNKRLSMEATT
jgi:RNA polymerase sigma-70 factor (ECF subfamily)